MSEVISRAEFDARLEAGSLALTLVGMSNVGKSHWSTRLAEEAGFKAVGCDDIIEAELGDVLQQAGFSGGITDMARWMGQPYDPQFAANQQIYLDLETQTMRRTLDILTQPSLGGNTVIDTTGSVVHTSEEICEALSRNSTVVHLEATAALREKMFRLYVKEPKPVVWGEVYDQEAGQDPVEALANSYPKLLEFRGGLYERMAHVTIPRDVSLDLDNSEEFLAHIRDRLPA